MVSQELKERALLYKLVERLMRLCQGFDRELDSRFGKLKLQLDKNIAISNLEPELNKLNDLLKLQLSVRDDNTAQLIASINDFGTSLQRLKGLEPNLRRELRAVLQEEDVYGGSGHQQRLIKLCSLYQQTLLHKLGAELSGAQQDPQHEHYCHELQQIIADIEAHQGVNLQLSEIRAQLFVGISVQELPSMFLNVIHVVVDDLKTEKNASQEFLSSLDDSLYSFLTGFSQSLADSQQISTEKSLINRSLKEGIASLSHELSGNQAVDELKQSITKHLSSMSAFIGKQEGLEQREAELLERLNKMEVKLCAMKKETADYKQRLFQQQELLYVDTLTGVPNRAALDERMLMEFKRRQRYKNPLALAVIDIDHFKKVNDTYGHLAGDKALKVIAIALKKSMRETDFVARFGGEEFVAILPNLHPEDLQKPLDLLRKKVKAIPFKFKGQQLSISISIGATLLKDSDEISDAFERADRALYEAKSSGRNATKIHL